MKNHKEGKIKLLLSGDIQSDAHNETSYLGLGI